MSSIRTLGLIGFAVLMLPIARTYSVQAQTATTTVEDAHILAAQGDALFKQKKYGESELLYRKVLDILLKEKGENHPDTASFYLILASSIVAQDRHAEAEPLYRKALEIRRATLGDTHLDMASIYNGLAGTLDGQGRHGEAEPLYRKALGLRLAALGENDPITAKNYHYVAQNLVYQGRAGEAEPLHRKALDIWRITLGENHWFTANGYHHLAANIDDQGRHLEAEPLYRKVLEIYHATLGENDPITALGYNDLGANIDDQGRHREAEPLIRRALEIRRAALGEFHRDTAASYNNVAFNLENQGRASEAGPLYRKALDIWRGTLGESNPITALGYNNVAASLRLQGKYIEAGTLYRKALDIYRATLGERHSKTARGYNGVARNLNAQGRYTEAEPLYAKALDIRRAERGEIHPDTANSYSNIAANLDAQGRYGEAEPLYRKALHIFRAMMGETHPNTALSYDGVAKNLSAQGRYGEAEIASAQAVESARLARSNAISQDAPSRSGTNTDKPVSQAYVYSSYLAIAAQLAAKTPGPHSRLQFNAFRAAQDIIGSASAQAMADAAVRAAAGTDALARLAREEQDLGAMATQIDKRLLAALSRGDTVQAAQLRSDYEATLGRLSLVEVRIDKDFPTYRELISPKPLELVDAQKALAPGEGLLVLVVGGDAIYSFALTPGTIAWNRVEGDAKTILKQVETIRCDVDVVTCSDEQKKAIDAVPATKAEQDGYQRFDLVTAHALYKALIAPVELALGGVNRLYVTSSGSLGDLPLGMLVTAPPAANADLADPDVLLSAQWLSDRYALTTLPAVSALRLRAMAKADLKPSTDFRGYGNPVLAPAKGEDRGGTYYRGAGDDGIRLGDPDRLRTLPSLPGTETELLAMAALYPSGTSALTMGAGATESALKHDPLLKQANIIALATHGLLPSPGRGMDEPGLVFTPPKIASKEDDGILTASEVSQLSFLADWVILSACNTASTASGAGGSDSLSALARAFLYAGAHALLASHWQVSDTATAALTVETLTALRDNPKVTRAQALQQAMRSVRTGKRPDGSPVKGWDQQWLHPSAWAPFSHIANSDE